MTIRSVFIATFFLVIGVVSARADYYPFYGSYYSRQTKEPIVSLELDPRKSLDSAFRIAAREERLDDVKRYLTEGAEVNSRSDEGVTALMYAARECSTPTVSLLLDSGADANLRDDEGRGALIYAIRESCGDTVRELLRISSLRVDARDREGRTPLDYALDMAETDVGGVATQIATWVRDALERQTLRRRNHSVSEKPFH